MEEKEIIVCKECGCIIEDGQPSYEVRGGGYVCQDCRDSYYVYCEECDELVPWDDALEVDGHVVCEDCLESSDRYFQCDCCGEWHESESHSTSWWSSHNYYTTWDDRRVCITCGESEQYCYCDDCGQAVETGDVEFINDDQYCPSCAPRHRTRIHGYSYKPDPVFKTIHDVFLDRVDKDGLYMGVELEVDDGYDRQETADELTQASEDIYCKTDGSLHRGIEIVSHPCTLEYHKEALGWDKLIAIARKHDFESDDTSTCGLHIHVGIHELGKTNEEREATKAKLVMLVKRHWDQLLTFSRREDNEINEWAAKPKFRWGVDADDAIARALATESDGRYQAVNLTNRHTVEFRLFKGTMHFNDIIAALELVSNFCHYAMDHDPETIMRSQWEEAANCVPYEELISYEKELDMLPCDDIQADEFGVRERGEFRNGDVVRITAANCRDEEWMVGKEVIVIRGGKESIGVDFGIEDSRLHTCGGRLNRNRGYYVFASNLEIVRKVEDKACA